MRRKRQAKRRTVILGSIITLLFIMSVGYAAFETNLTFNIRANFLKKTAADQLKEKAVISGDGLYIDSLEDNRYVYVGANPDNYITFNGEEAGWRIISVEPDKTIKIMKIASIEDSAFDKSGNRTIGYCEDAYNSRYGCNVWAKSDIYNSADGTHIGEVESDSTIKESLNNSYYSSIQINQDKIQPHEFYYGSITRESANLAEQIAEEKKASVVANVGLIQMSDYLKSNSNQEQCGTYKLDKANADICKPTSWLVKDITGRNIWTISADGITTGYVTAVLPGGGIDRYQAHFSGQVHPVVYLKLDEKLAGSGKKSDPYTIKDS